MLRLIFLLGFAFFVPALCLAQDEEKEVRLVWKAFDERLSKPYFQEMRTTTNQLMKVMGADVKQTQDQTFVFRWTPHLPDREQNWLVTQEILLAKMIVDAGGAVIKHDTDLPAGVDPSPLGEFFKALVNTRLRFTIDRGMKVKEVTGQEAFVKKLVAANPVLKPTLEAILSKDAMVQMVEPTLAPFPVAPVKKGSKWERSVEMKLGPLGTYVTNYTFTYEGRVDGLDKIAIASTIRYAPPREAMGGLPFKIKKGELRGRNGRGLVFFDRELGRFVRGEQTLEVEGELTIEAGGMDHTVSLRQQQTMTFRTADEQPK